jgi:hypothetical protein
MDSLPTGSVQSWVIVASASLSPILILFLADVIGRLFRFGWRRPSEQHPQGWESIAPGFGVGD